MKPRLAKLVPPHMDKHHSFQIVGATVKDNEAVRYGMSAPAVKAARPFLQGESRDWLMVEFWTDDAALIQAACLHLAAQVELPLLVGEFTRAELGLTA